MAWPSAKDYMGLKRDLDSARADIAAAEAGLEPLGNPIDGGRSLAASAIDESNRASRWSADDATSTECAESKISADRPRTRSPDSVNRDH